MAGAPEALLCLSMWGWGQVTFFMQIHSAGDLEAVGGAHSHSLCTGQCKLPGCAGSSSSTVSTVLRGLLSRDAQALSSGTPTSDQCPVQ